jgi:hypothetical protein
MTRLRRSRPSPALVVALAGTVGADPVAQTSISKKKTKKIARNQANKAVDAPAEAVFPIGGGELGEITERSQTFQVTAGTTTSQTVNCEANERVISGGSRWDASTPHLRYHAGRQARGQRLARRWHKRHGGDAALHGVRVLPRAVVAYGSDEL